LAKAVDIEFVIHVKIARKIIGEENAVQENIRDRRGVFDLHGEQGGVYPDTVAGAAGGVEVGKSPTSGKGGQKWGTLKFEEGSL